MSLKTGLIDLNGIEIEEGHIIVFQSEYNENKPNQYEPRYKVQFDFGAFVGIKQYTIENGKLYTEKNYKPSMSNYGIEVLREHIDVVYDGYISNYGETYRFANNIVKCWIVDENLI